MIVLAPTLWDQSVRQLRACGSGRRECVVYLTGAVNVPGLVDAVIHPMHRSTAASYELDSHWLHEFWVGLHRDGRAVRAQVHTHAFEAFHSHTDDQWPIVHTAGFASVVVPRFAQGFQREEIYVTALTERGTWQEGRIDDLLGGIA